MYYHNYHLSSRSSYEGRGLKCIIGAGYDAHNGRSSYEGRGLKWRKRDNLRRRGGVAPRMRGVD